MNAHLKTTTAMYLHPDMSTKALEEITGVRRYGRDTVPIFGLDDTVTETPALKLRRSDSLGGEPYWQIVDNLDEEQRIALGARQPRVRVSTGCREGDREAAVDAFLKYADDKQRRIWAAKRPDTVPVSAILVAYQAHLDGEAHNLARTTVPSYAAKLVPIGEFLGKTRLGSLGRRMFKAFETWRRRQTKWGRGKKQISLTQVRKEIETFRQAVNHFKEMVHIRYEVDYYLPKRDTPPVTWWRRREIARYLWACRGRISVPILNPNGRRVGWRWKVARDDDPSLTGPEGDKRVLRPKEEIARREAEARRVLCGIFVPSRGTVLLRTTYAEESAYAYASFLEGLIRRKPIGQPDTNKRRPPAPFGPILGFFLYAWAFRDALPNEFRTRRAMTLVHAPDGRPIDPTTMRRIRKDVLADAGVDKPLTDPILRHTAAMWMKQEKITAWAAGNFLGCSARMAEERYGTFDNAGLIDTAWALCYGKHQKQAMRKLVARGLDHLA